MLHLRDPVHGAIDLSAQERTLLDAAPFQRLRFVKQLGFSDLVYPGATHTRFAHSVGTMHVAGRMFDVVSQTLPLPAKLAAHFRQVLRLAALSHDLGHPPLSHSSERALPALSRLGLPAWAVASAAKATAPQAGGRAKAPGDDPPRRAKHEDYSRAILLAEPLAGILRERFGVSALEVVSLLGRTAPECEGAFVHGGVDYAPLLAQMVSSELDADRMDYLLRDSKFSGVSYGSYDLEWLLRNLGHGVSDGKAYLAIDRRAVFAFEDFLLARYQMFIAVYFHRSSVAYDALLHRYYERCAEAFSVPTSLEDFYACDDLQLYTALRASTHQDAKRIVQRRGHRVVCEDGPGDTPACDRLQPLLEAAGLDVIRKESHQTLSRYLEDRRQLFVLTPEGEVPLEGYTTLFDRPLKAATLLRLYVPPESLPQAQEILKSLPPAPPSQP